MIYAGIGSRQAGPVPLRQATAIARAAAAAGHTLRSGHAPGMDQAFEKGAGDAAEIYLPWSSFEKDVQIPNGVLVFESPTEVAYEIAELHHPAWYALRRGGRALQARNTHQVLGFDCKTRADRVVCWTQGGGAEGGTGQAIRLAAAHGIPVFNLARMADVCAVEEWLGIDLSVGELASGTLF